MLQAPEQKNLKSITQLIFGWFLQIQTSKTNILLITMHFFKSLQYNYNLIKKTKRR